MTITRIEKISINIGEIRRKKWIRGRRCSNLLSSGTILIHVNKVNQLIVNPRWNNPWEKGQGIQLNVRDVNDTICTNIVLIMEIE
jgi:hypothetical protein